VGTFEAFLSLHKISKLLIYKCFKNYDKHKNQLQDRADRARFRGRWRRPAL